MAKERKFQSLAQTLFAIGEKIRFAPDTSFAPASSEDKTEKKSEKSLFLSYRLKIKSSLAKMCEQSFFLSLLSGFYRLFFSLRVRSFGVLFFSIGFLQILSYFWGAYIPFLGGDEENFLFGVCLVFLAILCSFSRLDVKDAIRKSFLFRSLLSPIFGIRTWQFPTVRGKDRFLGMIALGVVLAFFAIVFSPTQLIFFLFLIFLILFVFHLPEAGLVIVGFSLFLLPFPTVASLSFLTLLAFLCKCAVGKRSLSFSLRDGLVLLLFLPVAFSAAGGAQLLFFTILVLYYMTVYFLSTLQWIRRFFLGLIFGGGIAAFLLCARSFLNLFFPTLFQHIPGLNEILFVMPDSNIGTLMAMLCPLVLSGVYSLRGRGQKFVAFLVLPLLLGAIFFVKDAAIWASVLFSFILYFLFTYRSSLIWILSGGLVFTILFNVMPSLYTQKALALFGFGLEFMKEEGISLAMRMEAVFGAFLIPSLVLIIGVFLWQVILFRKNATKPEVFPRVLGACSSVFAFYAVFLQGVSADVKGFAFLAILLAVPTSSYRCAKREEQRLPY